MKSDFDPVSVYVYTHVDIHTFIHYKFIFIPCEDFFLYLVNVVFTKMDLELNEKNMTSVLLFALHSQEHN